MRLSASAALPLLLLLLAASGLTTAHGTTHGAHGDVPAPKLLGGGRRFLSELLGSARADMTRVASRPVPKTREQMEAADAEDAEAGRTPSTRRRRQIGGKDGKCGPGSASCAKGYCCSPEGWCGLTIDYCSAPDCLINYGSGCDANQKPPGEDTADVPRPHLGAVQYGGLGIYDCVKTGDIAFTLDDGPYNFTGDLLDKLASYGAKATFFITGNNLGKGMINDYSKPWAGYIRRMVAEGHQVASHTWSHQNASQLTPQQFRDQIYWNEIAFNDILGFFPTYMRPPYSICESACQRMLAQLGYHIVYFDLDTEGYLNDDASQIQTSKDIWDEAVDRTSPASAQFLMIEHDIHYQTVYNLTDYVLTSLFARGYRSVTVGECLGDPKENWYRQGPGSSSGGGSSSPSSSSGGPTATGIPTTTIRKPPPRTTAKASSAASTPASTATTRTTGATTTAVSSRDVV